MRRFATVVIFIAVAATAQAQPVPVNDAIGAMKRAAEYMDQEVATRGGYLWRYTTDLSERWGEGRATDTQVWVQSGTPMMGLTYLQAYEASGHEYFLDLAKKAADALAWGQLECGGWFYHIDFSEKGPYRLYYRHMADQEGIQERYNHGIFDDNVTQSALRLLMEMDRACGFTDPYHQAAMEGLDYMLEAQFDNGAWPQRYPYSESHYDRYYTFNDNAINDCVAVMIMAWDIYGDDRYLQSALDAGDFIIASQGDPPQAGWAQQYNWEMEPVWARKFEPKAWCPAVTSQNIRTLVDLYVRTGLERFLDPIPQAIDWLQTCKIGDNLWPRFVEIGSNRPLYFTREYELVYTDDDLPTHYSFQGAYGIPESIRQYRQAKSQAPEQYYAARRTEPGPEQAASHVKADAQQIREIMQALDQQGRWVRDEQIITRDVSSKMRALASYVRSVLIAREE